MLLNTQTRMWSNGPEMNNARYGHGRTSIQATEQSNAQIIVVGGDSDSTVEILEVSSNSWFNIAKIPLEGLDRNCLTASNSPEYKLYSIGGNYANPNFSQDLVISLTAKAIYGLTYSNTWIHVGDLTEARARHTTLNVARKDIPGCF